MGWTKAKILTMVGEENISACLLIKFAHGYHGSAKLRVYRVSWCIGGAPTPLGPGDWAAHTVKAPDGEQPALLGPQGGGRGHPHCWGRAWGPAAGCGGP